MLLRSACDPGSGDRGLGELTLHPRVQASASVQHLVLPCHWTQRSHVIGDLVRCYGACGRTIVCARPRLGPWARLSSVSR